MMSMMVMLSFILLFLYHPLSMGLILIMQTMIVSTIMGYMLTSFLFSYIVMIIMLSGALVLFIYMASVASNEKFQASIKMMMSSLMILSFIYLMMNSTLMLKETTMNNEIIALTKIFNMITSKLTLIMIIYLFMTMIVVSNVAKTNQGPLRMNKN
uniref:NADH dehydrogenase subunit 6 n=1 Tax=Aelia sibirica TaxID=1331313 RepID=UPI002237C15B|nr:NADH dehydrogenase subunit 6 [Aelia sibirica]UYA97075.1 NADH dehydrogenase subunit 6 [Aelia sibirica]